ncbi:MAG: hypothetical protein SPL06_07775, partial [Bacteroidales bacterium]|nr:hypothetical protein [Bacteroidales bacterium]
PNQENHGIVILIDLSGSMNKVLSGVLFQTAIITDFCMENNIPFEVLGFGAYFSGGQGLNDAMVIKIADNLHYSIVGILNFIPEILEQLRHWCNSQGYKNWDKLIPFYMGETPLDAGLMVTIDTFKKYKIAGVDKTILVVITDGDYKVSTEIWNNGNWADEEYHFPTWSKTIIDNEEINTSDYLKIEKKRDNTTDFYVDNIVWYIKKHFNTVTIFSFLSDIYYLHSLENDIKNAVKQNFGEVEIGGFVAKGYGYRRHFTYFEKTLKRMKCSNVIQLLDDDKINRGHPVDFGNGNGNPVWDKIFFQDHSFYIFLMRNISNYEKGLKKSDTLEKIIKNFESLRNIKSILSYLGNILIQEIV